MFVRDGKLNIAFRNISLKISPDEQPNAFDPTRGYRAFNKLMAAPGYELVKDNWAAMDVGNLPVKASARPGPVAAPGPDSTAPAQPAVPTPRAPVKERLLQLQELYDEGLITQDEYETKRKAILDEF